MQNPSRADALRFDDTAMRCNNLAVQWGWRGFGIVNLNPFIASNPSKVVIPPSSVQIENDKWISKAHRLADKFVLATGSGWRKPTIDNLKRLSLGGDLYMIEANASDDSFLHPSRIVDTSMYPNPKPIV